MTRNLNSPGVAGTMMYVFVFWTILVSGLAATATPASQSTSQPSAVPAQFKRILILGDSHVMGHFGKSLVSQLVAASPNSIIRLVGVCGGSERSLMTGFRTKCGLLKRDEKGRVTIPKQCRRKRCAGLSKVECKALVCRPEKIRTYMSQFRPDLLVLQLGSNSMWMGKPKTGWKNNRRILQRYVRLLKKSPVACVWITPPDSMNQSQSAQDTFAVAYEEELREVCRVFNSRPRFRPYLNYRKLAQEAKKKGIKYDRVHYGWFGAKGRKVQEEWARDVVKFIINPRPTPLSHSVQADPSAQVAKETKQRLGPLLDITMRWVKRLSRHIDDMRSSGLMKTPGSSTKPVDALVPR